MKPSILITGCSSGIGYFCAKKLNKMGFKLYATVRKDEDIIRLKSEGINVFKLDITSSKDIKSAFDLISKDSGKLDILFNNAGFGQPGALEDLSVESLKEQFETNLFGNFALTKKMLGLLRNSKEPKIIQNSSVLGYISLKYRGAYNASKYALEGLSDTLRLELKPFGIKVCLIEPGPISSDFRKNAYEKFKANVRVQGSFYESDYIKSIKRFESSKNDPFTLNEDAVFKILLKIINSNNPKPRYRVTIPSTMFWFLKRVLSTKMLDRVLENV